MTEQPRTSGVDRILNLLTVVRPGEARTALLLALNVFLILMAYYILKTVREALILGEGTAELKSYLSAAQVVTLAFVVPFYGRLVARFPRMRLINIVTVFFVLCPPAFYLLAQLGMPMVPIIYFIWIGIFSLMSWPSSGHSPTTCTPRRKGSACSSSSAWAHRSARSPVPWWPSVSSNPSVSAS